VEDQGWRFETPSCAGFQNRELKRRLLRLRLTSSFGAAGLWPQLEQHKGELHGFAGGQAQTGCTYSPLMSHLFRMHSRPVLAQFRKAGPMWMSEYSDPGSEPFDALPALLAKQVESGGGPLPIPKILPGREVLLSFLTHKCRVSAARHNAHPMARKTLCRGVSGFSGETLIQHLNPRWNAHVYDVFRTQLADPLTAKVEAQAGDPAR